MNAASLALDDRTVPLDGKSNLLVRYRGQKRTFPYVSAADVLSGRVPDAALARTRSCSSGRPRSARARSSPRRSTRCSPASRCRPPWRTTCCSSDFIHRPEYGVAARNARSCSCSGIAMALLGRPASASLGRLGGRWRLRRCGAGAVCAAVDSRRCSSRRSFRRSGLVAALAAMTLAQFTRRAAPRRSRGPRQDTSQRLMVQTLLSLTEVSDAETGRHSRRTQQYARLLAEQLATHPASATISRPSGSSCSPALRRCTTSARSACPITSQQTRAR